MVIASSLSTVTFGLNRGIRLTRDIIQTQFEDKLNAAGNMLELYLTDQFGTISLNKNGKLVDTDGQPIDGRYEHIDKLAKNMGVVSTVFAKEGNIYTRVLTTILNEKGERVIGTELDTNSAAYKEVSQGKTFLGQAAILGNEYITRYVPIFNDSKQIIGIYFVGVPSSTVNQILNDGISSTIQSVAYIIILILVLAAVAGIFLAVSIANPIKRITKAAQQIADGEIDVKLSVKSRDELGQLADSMLKAVSSIEMLSRNANILDDAVRNHNLNVSIDTSAYSGCYKTIVDVIYSLFNELNNVLYEISTAAEQVASSSNIVSDSSIALSQGATEQASSVEELSASIMSIEEQTTLNAKYADKANVLSGNTKTNALNGAEQMKDMLKAMVDINEASGSISKIIKVIDDIAFQTNILALNAAVEAARAGQHGKGFAVVAEEVRTLAAKSANAAKETTDMIESSIAKVAVGTRLANDTSSALNRIVTEIEKVADLVTTIATSSNEQAVGIGQINRGIQQISRVVQTNAATSEESAAASEELSSQATQLKDIVSVYRLKNVIRQDKLINRTEIVAQLPLSSARSTARAKISRF